MDFPLISVDFLSFPRLGRSKCKQFGLKTDTENL